MNHLVAGQEKQKSSKTVITYNQFISPFLSFTDFLSVDRTIGTAEKICLGVIRDIPAFCTVG